jgi:neutral ceramidase
MIQGSRLQRRTHLVSAVIGLCCALALGLLSIAGCVPGEVIDLPEPLSKPTPAGTGTLQAGFARVDITPPPGFGLFGYGPEGKKTVGYRNRLYIRALVLEGKNGEVIAFAVADLGVISTILHRLVAQKVHAATDSAIGADRLILSATHTHSAPGHYLSAWPLNEFGSSVMGYDPQLAEWLADRIATAVYTAYVARRPARAAWGIQNVWGHTRNRSHAAYRLNSDAPAFELTEPPSAIDDLRRLVNPRWAMLRVDVQRPGGDYVPAGALSIFAIHGTGFPSGNDLYDADIHGLVERGLERHIGPDGVHLFANGTQGDVSPNWPPDTRCAPAEMRPGRRPGGPRTPPAKDDWHEPSPASVAACLSAATEYVRYVGNALADTARRMFEGLAPRLSSNLSVGRAFETLLLTGDSARQEGLCERPQAGTATAAGGPDGRSRYYGWKVLGVFPLGIEGGGHAIDSTRTGCQRPKRTLLGPVQSRLVGRFQFPEFAELAVIRVGDMLIGTVPGEVTTVAGLRMMAAMQAVRPPTVSADNLAILGLANGDLRYITTEEEYWAQLYEGGSNLYGPKTAKVIAGRLHNLTLRLSSGPGEPWPDAEVGPISVRPGEAYSYWPETGERPDSLRFEAAPACRDDTVVARWFDAPPGSMVPAQGLVLSFVRLADGYAVVDDDIDVEVRAVGKRRRGFLWESRWTPPGGVTAGDRFTLTLLRWPGSPSVTIKC